MYEVHTQHIRTRIIIVYMKSADKASESLRETQRSFFLILIHTFTRHHGSCHSFPHTHTHINLCPSHQILQLPTCKAIEKAKRPEIHKFKRNSSLPDRPKAKKPSTLSPHRPCLEARRLPFFKTFMIGPFLSVAIGSATMGGWVVGVRGKGSGSPGPG